MRRVRANLLRGGWVWRAATASLAVLTALCWSTPPAGAHAVLDRSDPPAGATLAASPSAVTLHFTEKPDVSLSAVHVLDRQGRPVENGEPSADPAEPQTLRVSVPELPNGTYTVTWRTTSTADGHTTAGSFAFGVGEPPSVASAAAEGSTPSTPSPSPLGVAGRAALYAGLALLFGAAAVVLAGRIDPEQVSRGRAIVAAWLLAAIGAIALGIDQFRLSEAPWSRFVDSSTGQRWLWLLGATGVAGAASLAYAARRRRSQLVAIAAASGLAIFARVDAGHAAASGTAWFTVGTQWLHFAAVGMWIGGLPWFVVVLRRASAVDGRAALARRFSWLAAAGLALVAVTGVLRTIDEVGAWSRFVDTSFGKALLVKLGLVALVVGIGAVNRFQLVRRAVERASRLRRFVAAEVGLAAGVLVVTGVLTGLAPASSVVAAPTPAEPEPVLEVEGSDFATSVRVNLKVSPGVIGMNDFEATVTDYDTREPVAATSVSLRFAQAARPDLGRSTLELIRIAAGRWGTTGAQLSVVGVWQVTALVATADDSVEVPLLVTPRIPGQRVQEIVTPGQPTIFEFTDSTGVRLQAYADPGQPGFNEFHVTLFDTTGAELATSSITVVAYDPDGRAVSLEPRRFGAGHFVVDATLGAGRWTFAVSAMIDSDQTFDAMVVTSIPMEDEP